MTELLHMLCDGTAILLSTVTRVNPRSNYQYVGREVEAQVLIAFADGNQISVKHADPFTYAVELMALVNAARERGT